MIDFLAVKIGAVHYTLSIQQQSIATSPKLNLYKFKPSNILRYSLWFLFGILNMKLESRFDTP